MSSWRRAAPLLVLLVLAVVLLARGRTGSEHAPGERPGATLQGTVTRVVDGDTIHVNLGGRDETVRYIGMDTPESVKPGTPVQCYAEAASHRNQRLVDGQRVALRLDAETRDRYGRL